MQYLICLFVCFDLCDDCDCDFWSFWSFFFFGLFGGWEQFHFRLLMWPFSLAFSIWLWILPLQWPWFLKLLIVFGCLAAEKISFIFLRDLLSRRSFSVSRSDFCFIFLLSFILIWWSGYCFELSAASLKLSARSSCGCLHPISNNSFGVISDN